MKGIEFGINFLVVIVLAVLILSLGIVFLQGIFKQITGIGDRTLGKADEILSQELDTGDKEILLNIPSVVDQPAGEQGKFLVGVKNQDRKRAGLCYLSDIQLTVAPGCGRDISNDCPQLFEDSRQWFQLNPPIGWINSQEKNFFIVTFNIPKATQGGTYGFNVVTKTAVTTVNDCSIEKISQINFNQAGPSIPLTVNLK
ncbi:MAG: hypothetical protein HY512_02030 [Candidatus Aenigmarchaeota archaeon]|nr:hypothetical protein [Candidatus Aenigmarchaeota archaeon]